jgi:oligosaccharyltransferase complex subunit beta
MGELVDFVNLGGNVLIAGSSKNSEAIKDFAYEFSIDYATSNVVDYFRNNKDSQSILSSDLVGSKFIVSETNGPILYRGVGQYISGKNPLAQPLLIASGSAFSGEAKKVTESTLIGSKLVLVSSFQAINNARIIFAGSNDMFSNEFFNEKVTFNNKT